MRKIEDLLALLDPFESPGNSYNWDRIQEKLGVSLPDEYKELAASMPDGHYRGIIRINRPGDYGKSSDDFLGFYGDQLDEIRSLRELGHGVFPYAVFPEPGGLLPWATGPNLEPIFWLTEDADPGRWPIVYADREFKRWETYSGSTFEFVINVVEGDFDASVFGVEFAQGGPRFEPLVEEEPLAEEGPSSFFWINILRVELGSPKNEYSRLAQRIGPSAGGRRSVDWGSVEDTIGTVLPSDYKSFCEVYGPGTILGVDIMCPGGPKGYDFLGLLDMKTHQMQGLHRTQFDPPVFPEEAGIISWGVTKEGHTLAWLPTVSDPDLWPVVVAHPGYPSLNAIAYAQDLSFSSFMLDHLDPEGMGLIDRERPSGVTRFVPATPADGHA